MSIFPTLSLVERLCSDPLTTLEWYRVLLGTEPEAVPGPIPFFLFKTGSVRLAIKQGTPLISSDLLYFQVASLDQSLARLAALGIHPVGETKTSPEGYRRALFTDPDGGRVGLFESIAEATPG